jgi:AraC-like DNA-binding protein
MECGYLTLTKRRVKAMPVKLEHRDISDALRLSVDESIDALPKRCSVAQANRWLGTLCWNANVAMLNHSLEYLIARGMSRSEAVAELAACLHMSERHLYRRLQRKRA